eukprot:CAMPEP_0196721806 /NCGR_PEP_ID=MMETSP1091-20130531/4288_1 /TAXON_ID=302021 /ORGANISM="Rhodomonas sp., Strain CCMP768" /LENGTH=50 /DNA_ID=CAMNT_0042063373 /DNA_START=123 /DNA_END=272 /DNA_ORIENTATION=+
MPTVLPPSRSSEKTTLVDFQGLSSSDVLSELVLEFGLRDASAGAGQSGDA